MLTTASCNLTGWFAGLSRMKCWYQAYENKSMNFCHGWEGIIFIAAALNSFLCRKYLWTMTLGNDFPTSAPCGGNLRMRLSECWILWTHSKMYIWALSTSQVELCCSESEPRILTGKTSLFVLYGNELRDKWEMSAVEEGNSTGANFNDYTSIATPHWAKTEGRRIIN